MKFDTKFSMGDRLKDRVNGFEGVVTGITLYQNGCLQYLLTPTKLKDTGEIHESAWQDEQRLVPVETSKKAQPEAGKLGGPRSDAPPARYGSR